MARKFPFSFHIGGFSIKIYPDPSLFFRHTDVTAEFERLKANMNKGSNSQSIQPRELLKGSVLKPLLLSMALMLLQQFCGINSIIYFTVFVFDKAGSSLDKNLATIVSSLFSCLTGIRMNNRYHSFVDCWYRAAAGHYCLHVFG